MLIWLEIELHSNGKNIHQIAEAEWLNYETFTKKDWLNVKMSVEYYPQTIEYNFEPKVMTQAYLAKVKKFIQKQQNKYNLKLSTSWPWYVWMHIHIFDLKYRKLKWDELLMTTMHHINWLYDWLCKNSRMRLCLSHQLWWNYIRNNMPSYLNEAENNWYNVIYSGLSRDRVKYNPYIVSNRSNKWKPRSVEIRILPNELLVNNSLYELLNRISKLDFEHLSIEDLLYDWLDRLD